MINKTKRTIIFLLFALGAAGFFSSCGKTSVNSEKAGMQNLYDQYMDMPGQEADAFPRPVFFVPGDASDF